MSLKGTPPPPSSEDFHLSFTVVLWISCGQKQFMELFSLLFSRILLWNMSASHPQPYPASSKSIWFDFLEKMMRFTGKVPREAFGLTWNASSKSVLLSYFAHNTFVSVLDTKQLNIYTETITILSFGSHASPWPHITAADWTILQYE